jgi:hypothetical protein
MLFLFTFTFIFSLYHDYALFPLNSELCIAIGHCVVSLTGVLQVGRLLPAAN